MRLLPQMSEIMPIRLRKLVGAIMLIVLVVAWALFAMALAQSAIVKANGMIEVYVVAGLGWVLPAMPLIVGSRVLGLARCRPQPSCSRPALTRGSPPRPSWWPATASRLSRWSAPLRLGRRGHPLRPFSDGAGLVIGN